MSKVSEVTAREYGILAGGTGQEACVSLRSASFLFHSFPEEIGGVFLIIQDSQGLFHFQRNLDGIEEAGTNLSDFRPASTGFELGEFSKGLSSIGLKLQEVAGVLPIVHGLGGEDGSLLRAMELLGIPYAGCPADSSAICFDKVLTKLILTDVGVPNAPFLWCQSSEVPNLDMLRALHASEVRIEKKYFVKPARQGSSVGVSCCSETELEQAIKNARKLDKKILIEPQLTGRELECAALETAPGEWKISTPGEVVTSDGRFYTFTEKYEESSVTETRLAELNEIQVKRLHELCIKSLNALECRGFARLDFFLTDKGDILVNEVNTLPGFTGISMYPRLMAEEGFQASDLIRALLKGIQFKDQ